VKSSVDHSYSRRLSLLDDVDFYNEFIQSQNYDSANFDISDADFATLNDLNLFSVNCDSTQTINNYTVVSSPENVVLDNVNNLHSGDSCYSTDSSPQSFDQSQSPSDFLSDDNLDTIDNDFDFFDNIRFIIHCYYSSVHIS